MDEQNLKTDVLTYFPPPLHHLPKHDINFAEKIFKTCLIEWWCVIIGQAKRDGPV